MFIRNYLVLNEEERSPVHSELCDVEQEEGPACSFGST
jgi:hypothetical protein